MKRPVFVSVSWRVYLAEFGLSAAVVLDQVLQLVVDVLLSAAHLLQSFPNVLLQFVQVALRRQDHTQTEVLFILYSCVDSFLNRSSLDGTADGTNTTILSWLINTYTDPSHAIINTLCAVLKISVMEII